MGVTCLSCLDRLCLSRRDDIGRRTDPGIQCGNQLVLHRALKYVVRWCTLTNQPHIASLVVESITGMPAPIFSVVPRDLIPTEYERVWSHDWFVRYTPTIEELAAAM